MEFSVIFHNHIKSSFARILQEVIVPKVTIEIGVFEGESTFNITNLLIQRDPDYKHYAIDAFIQCNWNRLVVLEMPNGYQTAIKRVS